MSALILVFLDKTVGLRVPVAHETIGLDIAQLHESIIDTPTTKMKLLIKKSIAAASSSHTNNDDDLDGMGSVKDDLDTKNRGEGDGDGEGTVNDTVHDAHTNQPVLYTQKSILSGND
mgnify:CR=1 FL=1